MSENAKEWIRNLDRIHEPFWKKHRDLFSAEQIAILSRDESDKDAELTTLRAERDALLEVVRLADEDLKSVANLPAAAPRVGNWDWDDETELSG